jgi:hypothetical protein
MLYYQGKDNLSSPCLIGSSILKSNNKRGKMINHMSLFPKEDTLTKEIASWKSFADSLSSKEDRQLFEKMLNDCYKYAAALMQRANHFQRNHYLWHYCFHNIK